ncbi:MAG: hypothetical protein ACLTBV_31255 [Enterocloster bolteae]
MTEAPDQAFSSKAMGDGYMVTYQKTGRCWRRRMARCCLYFPPSMPSA